MRNIGPFALALSLAAAGVSAQELTASVCVRLPRVPPGAAAFLEVARSPATRPPRRVAFETALACIDTMRPGRYDVHVEIAGRPSASVTIDVVAGDRLTFRADADLRILDREKQGAAVTFDRADLDLLPDGGTLAALTDAAAPFAIADRIDDGGLAVGKEVRVGAHGASWTDAQVLVDGADLGDPVSRGQSLAAIDPNALEAVSFGDAGEPMEVESPGFITSVRLQRPAAEEQTSAEVSFTAPGMVSAPGTPAPPIAALRSFGDADVEFSAPVDRRLAVSLGGRALRTSGDERGAAAIDRVDQLDFTGQLIFRRSADETLRIAASGEGRAWPAAAGAAPGPGALASDRRAEAHVSWVRHETSGAAWTVRGDLAGATSVPAGLAPAIERLDEGPVMPPAANSSRDRVDLSWDYAAAVSRAGGWEHALDIGGTFGRASMSAAPTGTAVIGEFVDGLPARAWAFAATTGTDRRSSDRGAIFVSDRLTRGTIAIAAGLRADAAGAKASGAATGIDWRSLAPRVSARDALSARFALTASYARYQTPLTLDLAAWGDPATAQASVYRWTDPNGNGLVDASEIQNGTLVERAGTSSAVASIDPSLRAPSTGELTFGADVRPTASSTIRVRGIVRRERSLLGAVDTGAPPSAYTTIAIPDAGPDYSNPSDDRPLIVYNRVPSTFGADRYLLTNPAGDDATFQSVEIQFERRGARFSTSLGASASRAVGPAGNPGFRSGENDQGIVGAEFGDPNAATYAAGGRLFFDRAYVLKWTTTYVAAHGWSLGVIARYQDGQPFARWVIATGLSQGPEAVMAYPNGATRFTFLATVDARLMKRIGVGSHQTSFSLDVFNLLNTSNEVEEDAVTGPDFRQTTFVQPGRVLRASVQVRF